MGGVLSCRVAFSIGTIGEDFDNKWVCEEYNVIIQWFGKGIISSVLLAIVKF